MNTLKTWIGLNRAVDARPCSHDSHVSHSFAGLTRSTCVSCRQVRLERVGDGVSWQLEAWEEFRNEPN